MNSLISRTHALVRPPGESFAGAISSGGEHPDVPLARQQHQEYCAALAAAGLRVEMLPVDERFPDGCFMQDPAIVFGGQAFVLRLAAPSRQGEEAGAAAALAQHGLALQHVHAPGVLEGGDILVLPGRVLVGQTARSNPSGIAQLSTFLEPLDLPVRPVPVHGLLHLLTGVSFLDNGTLLALEGVAGHPAFSGLDIIPVQAADAYAANALALGEHVIIPAGFPRVAAAVRERGFDVLEVPTGEFARADGGVTCLSLVW